MAVIFTSASTKTLKMEDVIGVVNYKKIRTKKSNKTIYDGYKISNYKIYETKNKIKMDRTTGKILFVRSKDFNANIFQAKIKTDKNAKVFEEKATVQIETDISMLKYNLFKYLGINGELEPTQEYLTGKSKYNFPLPISESIYNEKRHYNSTYLGPDGNKYDLNFYMDGDYLVCELVKFLELKKK